MAEQINSGGIPIGVAELMSAAQLLDSGVDGQATYELSVRRLPDRRSYLLATGLQQALEMIESFRVEDHLGSEHWRSVIQGTVSEEALQALEGLRFEGEIHAVPEGTVVFEGEPVLQVRAPAPQAVLIGSALVSAIGHPTMVATEASRMVSEARGKPVYEFSVVSSFGTDAAVLDARAAFIGGTSGSTCVEAVSSLSIPPMALMSLDLLLRLGDFDVVRAALKSMSGRATVLLDTGTVGQGVRELLALGVAVESLLIDAGDLEEGSRMARALLDDAGWTQTRLLVTGGLAAATIHSLARSDAPIDGFGVGRQIAHGSQEARLALEYDLVEWEQNGKMTPVSRTTPGRLVEPFAKMVYRRRQNGVYVGDVVQRATDPPPSDGVPLLVPVICNGRRVTPSPSLGEVRALASSQLQMLDPRLLRASGASDYPVEWSVRAAEPIDGSDLEFDEEEISASSADPARLRAHALLQSIDDSSDFGSMSDALDQMVAAQLRVHPDAPPEAAGSEDSAPPADAAVAVSSPSPASDAPGEAGSEPAPVIDLDCFEVEVSPLVETPDQEEPVEEAPTEEPAPEAAPVTRGAVVEQGSPAPSKGTNAVLEAAAALKRARAGGSAPASAALPSAATSTPAGPQASAPALQGSEQSTSSADPLMAAAERLRSMSRGGGGAAPPVPSTQAATPAATPDASPKSVGTMSQTTSATSSHPLEAAAARLKALSGGGSPASGASSPAPPASGEPEMLEEIAPATQDGAGLLSAADRLKALRSRT